LAFFVFVSACNNCVAGQRSHARWHAALAHSLDMARQRYFSHQGKDGRQVGERALQAGYHWRRIGENIAVEQESADEAVAGWLSIPGHCANIMNRDFAVPQAGRPSRASVGALLA
jgi:hypothetical protein